MARGVNKAIIVGTVGQDPELKYSQNGSAICNLSVATNESWKDKQTGEKQERTEWHRISMFGKLAEIAGKYLRKGSQAYFEGRIQTRKWQDKEGNDRYSTEIVANEMQMLGGKNSGGDEVPARSTHGKPPEQPPAASGAAGDGFDDIPFNKLDPRCA